MLENEQFEKKSLLALTKPNPDWDELAKDCVCFANAQGGRILFGIEDKASQPETSQRIPVSLPARLSKEIQQRTLNVSVLPQIKTAENGGEFLELLVQRSATSIAGTSNGRYYVRVSDECKPLLPDELSRLLVDKNAFTWETQPFRRARKEDADPKKLADFFNDVRHSNRVSAFVRDKTAEELLEYYFFVSGEYLTNLGALWIGKREHRANLLYAPIIQFIKYDENEQKVRKRMWDDYELNPKELIQSVWSEIPEWQDGIEIPDGIFRKTVANYDEVVVRELLANALVHRPYTIRGDIFINLFTDRMEVHNPGLLPLGVTPQNILHKSVMRNPHLARVFYDLGLMEREGSGYDRMYEILLSAGKPLPQAHEGNDRVRVLVEKRIVRREIINFMDKVRQEVNILKSKELITLGLLAQHQALNAIELSSLLGLRESDNLKDWLGKLTDLGLVKTRGKTKGTVYFVNPVLLKKLDFRGLMNLKNIEPIRLRELIRQILTNYGDCSISDIQDRVGKEITKKRIKRELDLLVESGEVLPDGDKRWRRYAIAPNAVK